MIWNLCRIGSFYYTNISIKIPLSVKFIVNGYVHITFYVIVQMGFSLQLLFIIKSSWFHSLVWMLKENFYLKRNVQLQNKSSIPKVYENIKCICTCYKTVEDISEPHFSLFLKLIPINMIFSYAAWIFYN